ncbi:hypothetical protein CYMTET_47668 [Cymbomonas tetramitiformis]|uniref:Uncharacterized protein n=1 Tax=Cymbomonas tetramitiformis TaxID=36881 RepID=A0AAE0BVN5_9CHLO|nr:hypothetical protein CYMTET_47668 [Cymbomonas tetramitiformis]
MVNSKNKDASATKNETHKDTVSDDSMWPVDDVQDDDALSNISSHVPVSDINQTEPCKDNPLTVQLLLDSMQKYNSIREKAKSVIEITKSDLSKELQTLVDGRHQMALDRMDELVDTILLRASRDTALPKELRAVLPWLRCYSYTNAAFVDPKLKSNDHLIQLDLDVVNALRNKKLTLLTCEIESADTENAYSAYEKLVNECQEDDVLDVTYIRKKRDSDDATTAQELHKELIAVTFPRLKRRHKVIVSDTRVMNIYLMLYSLAKWNDAPFFFKQSQRDYLAILTLLLHRYP